MAKEYKDIVVGLDIGTAKIMVVVAEVQFDGQLKLAGLGVAPSNGLKRGGVVNIDATVQSIQAALKEAEFMADCKITKVYTGITGSHIRGQNSTGMVIVRDNREVTPTDVARVVETAKAINIPNDQRLLLVEPQEFVIDGQDVREPIGMSGIRLEAKVHIVTGAQSAAENIIKCVRRCGLEVDQLMLNPLASSLSVLTQAERELGSLLKSERQRREAAALDDAKSQAAKFAGSKYANVAAPSSRAGVAIKAALSQLGIRYRFGAKSPGSAFDCSGLTSWAWEVAGVGIPRTSRTQYAGLTRIPTAAVQPGDLIFSGYPIHHVGMYLGNGQYVHAPRTGDVVKVSAVSWSRVVGVVRPK